MRNRKFFYGVVAGIPLAAVVLMLIGATRVTGGRCATFLITENEVSFIEVGARNIRSIDISFDESPLGTASTQTLTLRYCSRETDASCADYDFDTTGDGVGDTNILLDDGVIETGGVRGISGFNYLRVSETGTFNLAGEASYTICRNRN